MLYISLTRGKVYTVHCTPPLPYLNRGIGRVENTVKVIVTARKIAIVPSFSRSILVGCRLFGRCHLFGW